MNNRSPFIPNIPSLTPQGHWVDPNIYSSNTNTNTNQHSGQVTVPFTAHQQVQFQSHHQPMYNVAYTTTSASQLPSLPLQGNSGAIFSDAWGQVNNGMQMNYSYQQQLQQVNQFQQQHQQIAGGQIMSQSQAQRTMQLALDTSFVHFPVNLSPPSGMLINSRSSASAAAMAQFASRPTSNNPSNVPLSFQMSRSSSNMSQFNTSPSSSPGPLPLDSRTLSSGMNSSCVNTSNSSPNQPLSLSSRSSNNANTNVAAMAANYLPMPLLNFNARSSGSGGGSSMTFSNSSSPPPNCVPRSPASMSPFSGSSSPSPTLQLSGNNSRMSQSQSSLAFPSGMNSVATGLSMPSLSFNTSSGSQTQSSSSSRIARISQPSPSPNQHQSYHSNNNRSPINMQQAHQSGPSTPIAYVPQSSSSPGPGNSRSSVNQIMQKSPPSSPLLLKEKKQRAPRKPRTPKEPKPPKEPKQKRTPKKPIPINASSLSAPSPSLSPTRPVSNLVLNPSLVNSWPAHLLQQIHLPVTAHLSSTSPRNRSPTHMSISPRNQTPAARLPTQIGGNRLPIHGNLNMNPVNIHPPTNNPNIRTASVIQTSPNTSLVSARGQSTMNHPLSRPPGESPPRAPMAGSPIKGGIDIPSSNARLSVLDYALERAGIPQNPDISSVEIFQESEILQLVSEIPEPTTEMLNPNGEKLKSPTETDESISSWEREAFNRALGTHSTEAEDLESELNRFYCPPSPKGGATGVATGGTVVPAATTQSVTTAASSTALSVPSSSSSKAVTKAVTLTVVSASSTSTTKKPCQTSTKSSKEALHLTSDDDDCEVILVKLSDKKRRRPPPGNPNAKRGGPTKKLTAQQQAQVRGASNTHGAVKKGVDPRSKAMARPAYPNGRYITVAPKTTVPIPPAKPRSGTTEGSSKTPAVKSTARKSTAGVAYTTSSSVRKTPLNPPAPATTLPSSTNSRSRKPPAARTAAKGSQRNKVLDDGLDPSLIIDISSSRRPKRNVSEIDRFCIEPTPKMTRQQVKAMQVQMQQSDKTELDIDKYIKQEVISSDKSYEPPIKIKVNLKDGTSENIKDRPGPRSKKSPDRKYKSIEADSLTNFDVSNKNAAGSEDDLQIVEEYYADSDGSFDMEGERDEASSESETESEDEEESSKGNVTSTTTTSTSDDTKKVMPNTECILPEPDSTADLDSIEWKDGKITENKQEEEMEENPTTIDADAAADESTLIEPEKKSESIEKKDEEEKSALVDDVPEHESSGDDSESDIEMIEETPKVFEMPKPKVILKGTKEDADKAVADMRKALAQLTKFKLPFFGSR